MRLFTLFGYIAIYEYFISTVITIFANILT